MRLLSFLCLWMLSSPLLGLTYGPLTQISPTGNNGVPPLLAVSNNGNAFAVWINYPTYTLQVAYYNNAPGGGWQSATIDQGASDPQLAMDDYGNAFLVYVKAAPNLTSTTQIFVSRFTAASPVTPTLTTQLSTTGTYNSSPQIAVTPSGSAVVFWLQTQPNQFLSRSFDSFTNIWNPAVQIPFNMLPASMALDATGNGFAIFNFFSNPNPINPTAFFPINSILVSRVSAP